MPSPARVRWAKFRSAAVSLVALLILSVLFYLLTGGTLLQQKTKVFMYIPDATGLSADSPVRADGVGIGKVAAVELSGSSEPGRVVKVTMTVRVQALDTMSDDSYAQISTESPVGDKFVDITTGRSAGRLRPGSEVTFKEQADIMKSLDIQQLEETFRDVDATLAQIEDGTSRVGEFVKGDEMYRNLVRYFGDLEKGVQKAVSVTGEVGRTVYGDQMLRGISGPLRQLDLGLAKLQSGQGDMGRLLHDPAQYEALLSGVREMRGTVADLKALEFLQSERHHMDWGRAIDSLIHSVDEFNAGPAFGPSATYDNLKGMAKELQDTVKDFRENPRKYMRLKIF